ncbi:MAG TPA: tetratricopeptide repeat protein, partial [Acidimicrobiales bacterium]|nr:tetratricopeptide repeat protein [Acidimicrobiales bacterium]
HQPAAGLSLLHHVMLGPAHARDRAAVADEMIEVARSCGDELQTLTGTLWKVVDQLLLGEDADQALVQLRERADTLGMQAIVFIADSIAVMGLMRDGYLRQAEMAADRCLAEGIEVGDADASVYYGAHILAARWYAGNTADLLEVAEDLTRSSVMPPENKVFLAVVAAIAAGSGDVDRAERAISAIGRNRLRDMLPSSSWMVTVFALIEAAGALGDRGLSEELYDLLAPYADLPILVSVGVCCFGSAERSLGLAARTAGRIDAAVSHLERAVVNNTKMGNRPMTAITRGELAETLVARGEPGDRERAADLFTRAIDMAETMGLEGRQSRWIRCRDDLESGDSGVAAVCTRMGGEWELVAGAEHAYVRHTVGMSYISALLAAPHAEIPAGELAGTSVLSTGQEVLDSTALRTVRLRQQELQEELSVAARLGRPERSDRCRRQLEDLEAYLRTATGPRGRRRRFDDATERARTSVQKAVSRAIDNICREAPRLGDELRMSIRTGYRCSYEPRRGAPQRWRIQAQ